MLLQTRLFDTVAIAGTRGTPAISGREVDVERLDGGKLVEHGSRREAGSEQVKPCAQRYMETVG
jgi:hypothetical protein